MLKTSINYFLKSIHILNYPRLFRSVNIWFYIQVRFSEISKQVPSVMVAQFLIFSGWRWPYIVHWWQHLTCTVVGSGRMSLACGSLHFPLYWRNNMNGFSALSSLSSGPFLGETMLVNVSRKSFMSAKRTDICKPGSKEDLRGGSVKAHLETCIDGITQDSVDILGSTSKWNSIYWHALWIRELKSFLNTQDTMRSRDLKLTISFEWIVKLNTSTGYIYIFFF